MNINKEEQLNKIDTINTVNKKKIVENINIVKPNIEEMNRLVKIKEKKRARVKFLVRLGMTNYIIFILILPLYVLFSVIFQHTWKEILNRALHPIAVSAYIFTIKTAIFAAFLNTFFGLLITWTITRLDFKGKRFLDAAIDLPLGLPTSVAGITLTAIFGNNGWLGPILKILNFKIIYTKYGVLLAMMFASFPLVVRSIQPVLENFDYSLEEAAWCFGASSFETAWRVIITSLIPALISGFTLSFARALGEFGSVVMLSSNLPFDDLVTSVLIFQNIEQYDYFGACVYGAVMLILAFIIIFSINLVKLRLTRYKRRY